MLVKYGKAKWFINQIFLHKRFKSFSDVNKLRVMHNKKTTLTDKVMKFFKFHITLIL